MRWGGDDCENTEFLLSKVGASEGLNRGRT